MKEHKTIGSNFVIGQKATTILPRLFPDDWLWRHQMPDFHVDFVVEPVENGEPTGSQFGVQLKGTRQKNGKAARLKYQLKTKHLRYFLRNSTFPVFLILLDVDTGKAFWVFTQKFANEKVTEKQLKTNRTLMVSFSAEDCLNNFERFRTQLAQAQEYLREMHPGSVAASIAAEKKRLESVDPNVDVAIEYRSNKKHILVTARNDTQFHLKISGPATSEFQKSFADFVESGAELILNSSQVQVEGAPLLKKLVDETAGDIVMKAAHEAHATLQVLDLESAPEFRFQMEGITISGRTFTTFRGALTNAGLEIEMKFSLGSLQRVETHAVKISLHLGPWAGQPIRQLAHFDTILRLMEDISAQKALRLKFLRDGNELFQGDIRGVKQAEISRMIAVLGFLRKARAIAEHFNLNPLLPVVTTFSREEVIAINEVYDLINGRTIRNPAPGFDFTMEVVEFAKGVEVQHESELTIHSESQPYVFFGQQLRVPNVRHRFTNATIHRGKAMREGECEIRARGNENSEWIKAIVHPREGQVVSLATI